MWNGQTERVMSCYRLFGPNGNSFNGISVGNWYNRHIKAINGFLDYGLNKVMLLLESCDGGTHVWEKQMAYPGPKYSLQILLGSKLKERFRVVRLECSASLSQNALRSFQVNFSHTVVGHLELVSDRPHHRFLG